MIPYSASLLPCPLLALILCCPCWLTGSLRCAGPSDATVRRALGLDIVSRNWYHMAYVMTVEVSWMQHTSGVAKTGGLYVSTEPLCFPWGCVLCGQQCDPRTVSRCEVDRATSPASGSHPVGSEWLDSPQYLMCLDSWLLSSP